MEWPLDSLTAASQVVAGTVVVDMTSGMVVCSAEAQVAMTRIVAGDTEVVAWAYYHIPG